MDVGIERKRRAGTAPECFSRAPGRVGMCFMDVDRRVWREMFIPSSHLIATGDVSARAGYEERTPDWRSERVQPA